MVRLCFVDARQSQLVEKRHESADLLSLHVCNDSGLKPLRPIEDEDFHDAVAERYGRIPMVWTSSLGFGNEEMTR
jgi:hypothetical protein